MSTEVLTSLITSGVVVSLVSTVLFLVLRTLGEIHRFRGSTEAILTHHDEAIASISRSMSTLDCRRPGKCNGKQVQL